VQELRQWQRDWREENRAKITGDDKPPLTPSPPPLDKHNVPDSPADTRRVEDSQDKTDEKNIVRVDETKPPASENTRPEPVFCC